MRGDGPNVPILPTHADRVSGGDVLACESPIDDRRSRHSEACQAHTCLTELQYDLIAKGAGVRHDQRHQN